MVYMEKTYEQLVKDNELGCVQGMAEFALENV